MPRFFLLFFNWSMIYNVVLVSAVWHSDFVIHIYILFHILSPLWFIMGY